MELLVVPGADHQVAVLRQGSGPPVVLVHGWMCDHADMLGLARDLAVDHEGHVVDLRGHGSSNQPDSGFGLDDFADDLVAVIDRLELAPALIVGHSMGGAVALVLAVRAPALVSRVVLVDAPWAVTPPAIETVESAAQLWGAEFEVRRERLRSARRDVLGVEPDPGPTQAVAAESFQSLMDWDGPAALATCTRPVAAILSDGNWPKVESDLPRFPAVHVVRIPNTGHWIQVEQPAAVAAAIRAFDVDQRSESPAVDGAVGRVAAAS